MRVKYLFLVLLFALISFSNRGLAQVSSEGTVLSVSQLSDEQLVEYWQRFQQSGLSEDDAYKILAQKGMSEGDLQALKDRVTALGLDKNSAAKPGNAPQKKSIDFSRTRTDTVVKPTPIKPQLPLQPKLEIYGSSFFNQTSVKFEPNFSLATPKNYVLGPGDEVIVLLNGLNESMQKIKVSPDGDLKIDHAGLVYVNGFTIEQATGLIKRKMTLAYPALATGKTQLAVNLGNTRSIRITILGEVKTPGSYTASSLTTLFNILYNSGGPTQNGSLRYIELIRNNKVYKTVDFYTFLKKGLLDGDVRLQDQDVIHIPVYKKRVSVSGEVKTPAIFELKENETLENLIEFAGGFTDSAYRGIAKIDQINILQHEVKDVPSNLFPNYIPHNGDLIHIGAVTNRYTNRIFLEGAVYRPGIYELTAGLTLGILLKNAQGLKPDAYMQKGYIQRTQPNLDRDMISFNPADVVNGKMDIPLLREDSVIILDRDIFLSNQKVSISGYVRKPLSMVYRKGLKLADIVAMAGGFADEAAAHHVEIARIIPNQSDTVANKLVQTFVVNLDSLSGTKQDIELQPMDRIFVSRLVNYRPLGNVSVKGEVLFPGDYAVQSRNEKATDFLKQAGGITPYGSLENAQIYRKHTRVNVDLTKLSGNDSLKNNLVLLPGDSIYVPRVITYVEVSGAVNNPQYVNYDGHRFKYYINAAGGTKENARIIGAYIQYPNGLNRPVRHFLFFRNYPSVKPGSKIIVPLKTPDTGIKIGFGDLGGIAAALTAIVSIIAIVHK